MNGIVTGRCSTLHSAPPPLFARSRILHAVLTLDEYMHLMSMRAVAPLRACGARPCALSAVRRRAHRTRLSGTPFVPSLQIQRRFLEYWAVGVSAATQEFAQGDMMPRVSNVRIPVNQPSTEAASVTGNQNNMVYDSSNIFHVTEYSPAECAHYQSMRGTTTHRIDAVREGDGKAMVQLMMDLTSPNAVVTLDELWWRVVLKDFPSLHKVCTAEFQKAWQDFYATAGALVHDKQAVRELAAPFMRTQMQKNYISYAMVWRLAERLADALEMAPAMTRYERRATRVVVECVTKIALDTIREEPWAHADTTDPLLVDVSNFRAWHEAGFW